MPDAQRHVAKRLRLTKAGYDRLYACFPRDLKGSQLYEAIANRPDAGVSKNTVDRILKREKPVLFYGLSSLFKVFGLEIEEADYEAFSTATRATHRHYFVPHELSKSFTGRKQEIEDVRSLLKQNSIAAICGMGGMGKTQTALAWCEFYQDEHDYVFWLRAKGDTDLQQGYAEIARQLKLPGAALGAEAQAEAAISWLEKLTGWILVLDNLDQPKTGKLCLPKNPKCHILITTRVEHLDFLTAGATLALQTLSPSDSLEFFLRRCRYKEVPAAERVAATELAALLGHLPLAMEQAVAYIAHMTTFANYLALYKKRKLAQLNKRPPITGEYPPTVSETLAINFEVIEAEASRMETAGRYAAELLRFSAFLAPDDIPMELIRDGSREFCPGLRKLFEDAADDAEAEEVYNEAIEPLTRYSLAARKRVDRAFSLHRLVQEVTKDRLSESERQEWEERVVRAVSGAFPFPEFEEWELCRRLLPHALVVGEIIREAKLRTAEAAFLLDNVGRFLFECGRYPLAESYYHSAREIWQTVYPDGHPRYASNLSQMGLLRHLQERCEEATAHYNHALHMRRQTLPANHMDIAQSLNNLAGARCSMGLYEEAEPLFLQALEVTRLDLPKQHRYVGNILNNLALLYYRQKRNEEAEEHYKQALAVWRIHLAPNHPQTATCAQNLAELYRNQHRFEEAEPLFLEALSMQQHCYPEGHPDLAITHHNLAHLYEHTGRGQKAEHHFTRMLEVDRHALGEDHPEVAADAKVLAAFYQRQGKETATK